MIWSKSCKREVRVEGKTVVDENSDREELDSGF